MNDNGHTKKLNQLTQSIKKSISDITKCQSDITNIMFNSCYNSVRNNVVSSQETVSIIKGIVQERIKDSNQIKYGVELVDASIKASENKESFSKILKKIKPLQQKLDPVSKGLYDATDKIASLEKAFQTTLDKCPSNVENKTKIGCYGLFIKNLTVDSTSLLKLISSTLKIIEDGAVIRQAVIDMASDIEEITLSGLHNE